jgi:hypothetical protein
VVDDHVVLTSPQLNPEAAADGTALSIINDHPAWLQ